MSGVLLGLLSLPVALAGPIGSGPLGTGTATGNIGGSSSTTDATTSTTTETSTTTSTTASAVELGDAAAAVVLGTAVDTVARPSTAPDLAISLGAAFSEGKVPSSYAVEVTPYWLSKASRNLGLVEHLRGGAPSLLHNLNVSFAASNDATDGTAAALAVRTTWWAPPGAAGKTATSQFLTAHAAVFAKDGEEASGGIGKARTAPTIAKDAPACIQTLGHLSSFSAELAERTSEKLAASAQADTLRLQGEVIAACKGVTAATLPKTAALCDETGAFVTPGGGLEGGGVVGGGVVDAARDTAALARLTELTKELEKAAAKTEKALTKAVTDAVAEMKKDPTKLAAPLAEYLDEKGFGDAFEGCNALFTRHQGWVVDLAAGASILSPDTSILGIGGDAVHLWLTPGWVGAKESVFLLGRVKVDDLAATPTPGFDFGAGAGYRWDRFAFELQALAETPIAGREWAGRATVGGDILIAKGLWFSTSIGGSLPADEPGSLLTIAGVKLGVMRERTFTTPTYADLADLL